MAPQPIISIKAGKLRLELNASVGGSISAFECIGPTSAKPILRKCHSRNENVLDAGCFPLVPFANRIRGGRFTFRGREIVLRPNMAGDRSPLHGQGWLSAWRVDEAGRSTAALSFRHSAGEWPWDYEARQNFAIDEGGLSLTLTCRNTSADPMPCGLGFHPYFPCGSRTRIDTQVTAAWTIDENVLPVEKVPAEGRYDLRNRLVCGQDLDNGWAGWGGSARMTDPDWAYELEMSSPQAKFFQLYSPPGGGIFVAEPVTHANAALNEPEDRWPGLGLRVLEPGEEMALHMRLDVNAKRAG
jgi:aldose 1-epimerase